MKFGILGRTAILPDTARRLVDLGHKPAFVITSKPAPEYSTHVDDFELLAKELAVPFQIIERIYPDQVVSTYGADVAISCNFPTVIPSSFIQSIPLGVLNLHGGDLPRYRGNACQAWAILNGEKSMGLCIHRMDGGELDSGEIMLKHHHPINETTRVGELTDWIYQRGPVMFEEVFKILSVDPKYKGEQQEHSKALRCFPLQPSDFKLNMNGGTLKFLQTVNAGSEPYAGAFCSYEEKKLIVWRVSRVTIAYQTKAVPGQLWPTANGVLVFVGDGWVKLEDITYDGIRCNPSEVLRNLRKRLT